MNTRKKSNRCKNNLAPGLLALALARRFDKKTRNGLEIKDSLRYNRCVEIKFEWYPDKETSNIRRHGISFSEAATVFGDPLSWTFPDPDHSIGEYRFLTIGMSSFGKMLMVSHVDRGENIRLISARKATRRERRYYEEER